MKPSKKLQHQLRQSLDQKTKNLAPVFKIKKGWIHSIRMALGISTRQLAKLIQTSSTTISKLEKSEVEKTITLKSLHRTADAMDCELVYMFIPKSQYKSLDEILEQKAHALASRIFTGISYSMGLEDQKVSDDITQKQIKNLAQELKNNLDPRIWALEKGKK